MKWGLRATILAGCATCLVGASPPSATVDISVSGLRSSKGKLLVCLTNQSTSFPDCSSDPNARQKTISVSKARTIRFTHVKSGKWAASIIHDENGNGQLDTRLSIPREGFGFSRNPAITFGPPKFRKASFTVDGDHVRQKVRMNYML